MAYITAAQIEAKIKQLATQYAQICTRFPLANSVEGRPISYLRIMGGPQRDYRPNLLITAGVHAREWAPPDALLSFIEKLLAAYVAHGSIVEPGFNYANRGVAPGVTQQFVYGPYTVVAGDVQNIVNNLMTFYIPMVNPDGRDFSLAVEAMWRKNRANFSHWQLVKVIGATGGTYRLTFKGATTGPISFSAGSVLVKRALELLTTVGLGNVTVFEPFPDDCLLVRFDKGVPAPHPLMRADSTKLVGPAQKVVVVDWGDGVDINRNFDIAWASEVYYSIKGEVGVSSAATLDSLKAEHLYRGPQKMSEVETSNVAGVVQKENIGYFLDLHLFAGKILLPWAIETLQTTDPTRWFGNQAWDRSLLPWLFPDTGRDGKAGVIYEEWFPNNPPSNLWTTYNDIGKAMAAEIKKAAGPNVAQSTYDVVEACSGLYAATGTAHDYVASLQFLPPHVAEGANIFAATYEAGDKDGYDGGFFPDQTTGQYEKVERDIHAGVVGLLLDVVRRARGGPPQQPVAPTPGPVVSPPYKPCAVATIAWGSDMHPSVAFLRDVRDRQLRETGFGRFFVKHLQAAYNVLSPPVASFLASHPLLRRLARQIVLQPLVRALEMVSNSEAMETWPHLRVLLLSSLLVAIPAAMVAAVVVTVLLLVRLSTVLGY